MPAHDNLTTTVDNDETPVVAGLALWLVVKLTVAVKLVVTLTMVVSAAITVMMMMVTPGRQLQQQQQMLTMGKCAVSV